MGGAERAERKRRQQGQAVRSVAAARGSAGGDRTKIIVVVVIVVLLAAGVIGGVLYINSKRNSTAEQPINPGTTTQPAAGVVEHRDGVVVSTGKPGAKATLDLYADFLCPICGEFQKTYGQQIEQAVNAGQLTVRYHMVPLLNDRSDPPGYSLDSANASLAAADAGKFTVFHDALYNSQPQEGGRGYDKTQLIKLGQNLGITDPKFAQEVNAGTYNDQINAAFQQTENDPKLQQDFGGGQKGFGTPTLASGGKLVSWQDPSWLQKLLAGQS